jgi:hypothetical protein
MPRWGGWKAPALAGYDGVIGGRAMTDYWVSKLFYDLQKPDAAAAYRADRNAVLARYPLKPEVRAAVMADDVAALARLVNPYLLRYYFSTIGTPDEIFIRRLRETAPAAHSAKG